ncbi:hypothetical protein POTOM_011274 [Populus tomentosa]|uniref:Uncharacterized protein n=1 Tax=Populus tomentosa TaxID=118781 RepID=A0A8X8A592_POPTO|nr:hypothetical protein POTOM_011274 [Populus tomentosa]
MTATVAATAATTTVFDIKDIIAHCLFFIADDSSGAKNGTMESDKHAASTNNTGIPNIAIIFVSMVAIGFLAFFLFKFWQKKKREEQYARLLKLFEEDDELEVELGLRD